jgi:cell division protein FtsL
MKKKFAIVLLILIVLSLIALAFYTYNKEQSNKKELVSNAKTNLLNSASKNIAQIKLS